MMTNALLVAAIAFMLWRGIVNGYRIITGTRYHHDYEWWFTWWPVFLSGPDEWDRCRAGRRSARLMWCRWVMRMRTKPGNYYVLPNWDGSRFTMLERPAWHFWVRRRRDPAPVGYDHPNGITIEEATAMEPR